MDNTNKAVFEPEIVMESFFESAQERLESEIPGCYIRFALYQLADKVAVPDILDQIAFRGEVKFLGFPDSVEGTKAEFESVVVANPTWLSVAVYADHAAQTMGYQRGVRFIEACELFTKSDLNEVGLTFSSQCHTESQ